MQLSTETLIQDPIVAEVSALVEHRAENFILQTHKMHAHLTNMTLCIIRQQQTVLNIFMLKEKYETEFPTILE